MYNVKSNSYKIDIKSTRSACVYLFLCNNSCRECLLVAFPTSSLAESSKMPFTRCISSCNLPHPKSLWCTVSVRPSLMFTPDRLELVEYRRTVMTVFSVKEIKNIGVVHFPGWRYRNTTLNRLPDVYFKFKVICLDPLKHNFELSIQFNFQFKTDIVRRWLSNALMLCALVILCALQW